MTKIGKWPSLDILRGLAVIFMLINHAAVKLMTDEGLSTGLPELLFFVSSFAPVLFFFTTGLGYGLAHEIGKPAKTKDILVKSLILIIADIFMRGGDFTVIGWDFLAFIAFSMILLHGLRGRKYGLYGAFLLIILLLSVRFGLGAIYDKMTLPSDQAHGMRIFLGLSSLEGVSYWFTPWLVYPLIGFILGNFGRKYHYRLMNNIGRISITAFILGLILALISYMLWTKGAILFRWGTVSINYFIASVSCLFLCMSVSWLIADKLKNIHVTNLLSMRGVSSLAVVPIHYFYLFLLTLFIGNSMSGSEYLIAMPFWLIVCFISAKLTNQLIIQLAKRNSSSLLLALWVMVAIFAFITTVMTASWWIFSIAFIAQYILCILLGFTYSKR